MNRKPPGGGGRLWLFVRRWFLRACHRVSYYLTFQERATSLLVSWRRVSASLGVFAFFIYCLIVYAARGCSSQIGEEGIAIRCTMVTAEYVAVPYFSKKIEDNLPAFQRINLPLRQLPSRRFARARRRRRTALRRPLSRSKSEGAGVTGPFLAGKPALSHAIPHCRRPQYHLPVAGASRHAREAWWRGAR